MQTELIGQGGGHEVVVGLALLEVGVGVVDEGIARRVVHRQAPGEVLRQRAGHCDRAAPRMVAADLRLVGGLGGEGRVLGVDDDRAGDRVAGTVAASDAFFPFADGLQILINAGVTAVVQPGGSVRDEEVIAAANAAGIAMFFTGTRHFSHA